MSYILDALKKAEAERKLGAVPGVHAQPLVMSSPGQRAALWRRPAAWTALTAVLTITALLAWLQPWKPAPAPIVVVPRDSAPVPPPAAADSAGAAVAETPVFTLDPQPTEAVAPKTVSKPPRKAGEPKPPKDADEAARRIAKKTSPEPTAVQAAAPAPAPAMSRAQAQAPTAPTVERIAALRELPENIQREIPALTINGYIYASNPADRSVLINNRLVREGEQVAPGVTLERMQPREAIMNFRGYRYRMSY